MLSDPRLSNVPVMEPSELVSKPKAGAGGADDAPSAEHQAKIQELKQMVCEGVTTILCSDTTFAQLLH